jgi:hypothetical protein
LAEHRKRLELAAAHVRQIGRGLAEREVDVAGEQVGEQRRAAAIGNSLEFGAGRLLKQEPGDIGRAADPDGAVIGLAVALLEPGDKPLEVVGRQVLARDDPDRRVGDQRHRGEIVHHVVGEIHGRGIEHVGLRVTDADRVSVGRG